MEGGDDARAHSYCVAVRKPGATSSPSKCRSPRMSSGYQIFKYPVLRGLGTLYQAMKLGSRPSSFRPTRPGRGGRGFRRERPTEIPAWAMGLNLLFSLAFFLFMYKFVPLFLATRLGIAFPALSGRLPLNMVDGSSAW